MTRPIPHLLLFSLITSMMLLQASCIHQEQATNLGDLDKASVRDTSAEAKPLQVKQRSRDEVRKAYKDYIDQTSPDDLTRINALNRLANIEYTYTLELLNNRHETELDSAKQSRQIKRTIAILETRIGEYPNAEDTDKWLYQLASLYEQAGEQKMSADSLKRLVTEYPDSEHAAEAWFRIAESAFTLKNFNQAEAAYTWLIETSNSNNFLEKATFKRGWSRYKQQKYLQAADDYISAVIMHNFGPHEKLSKAEHEQFNEYFRAIGLALSQPDQQIPVYQYFRRHPLFPYTHYTYNTISEIFLKQGRYSDAVAAHEEFIQHFPDSDDIPYSDLKILEIWRDSGFVHKVHENFSRFYDKYNPASHYWHRQNENSRVNRSIRRLLKDYVILIARHYHSQYQDKSTVSNFAQAEKWYKRYLSHYGAYANKDNIHFLYAELLIQHNQFKQALPYYESAAFDSNAILNKDAAYAAITTLNTLLHIEADTTQYTQDYITYVTRYAQHYPEDRYTPALLTQAAELAFNKQLYESAIELADLSDSQLLNDDSNKLDQLKAESYFELGVYSETETIYTKLLQASASASSQRTLYTDRLALSIYKQGEASKDLNAAEAIKHFARIAHTTPESTIASTGLYDAIALLMQHQQWHDAIDRILQHQQTYPKSQYSKELSKKLSIAYLQSDQELKAAQEFERLSNLEHDREIKSAALLQAIELYSKENRIDDTIRALEQYINEFREPYEQYITAMHKLVDLQQHKGNHNVSQQWLKRIIETDTNVLNNVRTDETRFIVSSSYLTLAREEKQLYEKLQLTLPLKLSLNNKKAAMTRSVNYYGQSAKNNIYEIITEATYSIAHIYKTFSQSLLESERPAGLSEDELEQYEILIEDQAFPFEDKAIEFHEINMSRIKDGLYNEWIKSSHVDLKTLYPVKYNRPPKLETHVSVLH